MTTEHATIAHDIRRFSLARDHAVRAGNTDLATYYARIVATVSSLKGTPNA